MIESYIHRVAFHLHVSVGGGIADKLLAAVGLLECGVGKTLAHLLFLRGMYLLRLIGIDGIYGRYHGTVGDDGGGAVLLLAEEGTAGALVVAIVIGGYLNEIEGQFAKRKIPAPLLH